MFNICIGVECTLSITHSTFSNNSATGNQPTSGALANAAPFSSITIADSTFLNNSSFSSGNNSTGGAIGVLAPFSALVVTNSTFSGNSDGTANPGNDLGGGAISDVAPYSSMSISGSTFSDNSSGSSGGGFSNPVPIDFVSITNSTFSGNSAPAGGGAISDLGALVVTNSTFFDNNSNDNSGGGISFGGVEGQIGNSPALVTGSVFEGESGGNCDGMILNGGYNASDDATCGFGTSTGVAGQTLGDNVNPLLDPAGLELNEGTTETIALQGNSPAIDAVPIELCPTIDQRGFPRPDPEGLQTACDAGAYESTPIIVNTTSDSSPSGDHLCSLREAINNANSLVDTTGGDCGLGEQILFSVSGTITLNSTLPAIQAGVSIDGSGQTITIDGAGTYQVLLVNTDASLSLVDLTIQNGAPFNGNGGAINNDGTLGVNNVTFSNNTAANGNGGAIFSNGALTVTASNFSGNYAHRHSGGAIDINSGSATISTTTFSNNTADDNGGAIETVLASFTISASTFTGNFTGNTIGHVNHGYGGAIDSQGGVVSGATVINNTFAGNSSILSGGGVSNFAQLMLINNTFSRNSAASGDGGGVSSLYGMLAVTGSIFAGEPSGGNCAADGGTITDGGYNISDDATCGFTGTGVNGKTLGDSINPLLDPNGLQDNGGPTLTIALQSTSPAIDAELITMCPSTDQRGTHRPDREDLGVTPACDSGAFESGNVLPTPTPTSTTTPTPTITPTPTPTMTIAATPTATATATGTAMTTPTPTATPAALASITFEGNGPLFDSAGPVTAIIVTRPAGTIAGDVLLAQIVVYDGTGTNVPSAPAGWTLIRHDSINGGNKLTTWLYYKVAGASEPLSYNWLIAAQYGAGQMGDYRGAAASPIDQASGATSASNPLVAAAPSLTPNHNNELQVYFYGSQNATAPTITEPTAITSRINSRSTKEGFTLAFGDLTAPGEGIASPTYSAKSTGGVLTAQAVLLIPAISGPPQTPTTTATPTATSTPTSTATATATPVPTSGISFVNASALTDTSSPVTTVTVNTPTGVISGDVMLAQIVIYDGTGTNVPSAPTGWTVIRHDSASNGNNITSWLYYKVRMSGETATSYSWNIASQYAAGVMGAWRGASGAPFDKSSGATTSGNPALAAAPSLMPSHNGELQVYFYASQNFAAPVISEPGAITSRANDRSSREGFALAFGDLAAPAQGVASPAYTASSSGSGGVVLTAQAVLLIAGP